MSYGVNVIWPRPQMTFIENEGVYVAVVPYGDTPVATGTNAVEATWTWAGGTDTASLEPTGIDGVYSGHVPNAPYGENPQYVEFDVTVSVDFQGLPNVPGAVEGVRGFRNPTVRKPKNKQNPASQQVKSSGKKAGEKAAKKAARKAAKKSAAPPAAGPK